MKSNISTWFLPVENYSIRTKLTGEQIIERLKESTKNTGFKNNTAFFGIGTLFDQRSGGPYEGTVQSKNFKISRIISYRNAFLPVIKGSISSFLNQSEITISMRMILFIRVFMIIWFSTAIISSFFMVSSLLNDSTHFIWQKFLPFQMAFLGYFVMILAFKFESRKSKKYLNTLFEAEA